MDLALTADEVLDFLDQVFPQQTGRFAIEALEPLSARVRMKVTEDELRPGGTVSGPAMFTAADCAFYIAVLGMIGREALTVTSTCTINFLRKPDPVDLIAECRILKLGRSLVTGDVLIYSQGSDKVVAQASLSYAVPKPG